MEWPLLTCVWLIMGSYFGRATAVRVSIQSRCGEARRGVVEVTACADGHRAVLRVAASDDELSKATRQG